MERLDKELTDRTEETMRARAQRDQLLAALKQIEAGGLGMLGMREVARAAVAAVEDD
jgi:hypothetical protein